MASPFMWMSPFSMATLGTLPVLDRPTPPPQPTSNYILAFEGFSSLLHT